MCVTSVFIYEKQSKNMYLLLLTLKPATSLVKQWLTKLE